MSLMVLVNVSEQLRVINDSLPVGIKANAMLNNGIVYVSFNVRYEQRGKKISLGTFLDRDAAIRALVEHRITGKIVKTTEELNSQMELMAATAQTSAVTRLAPIAKPREVLSNEEIERLLLEVKGMHVWQVTAENAIDVLDGDVMRTITPAEQSAWLAWKFPKEETKVEQKDDSSITADEYLKQQKQEVQEPSEQEPQMSDEEYNRMMGLDDE